MMLHVPKSIQQAEGWFAKYKSEDGTLKLRRVRCWATVSGFGVVGISDDYCETSPVFCGYVHKDDLQHLTTPYAIAVED
ncbi:hypothetical protein [Azospirillum sp. sgz301742]